MSMKFSRQYDTGKSFGSEIENIRAKKDDSRFFFFSGCKKYLLVTLLVRICLSDRRAFIFSKIYLQTQIPISDSLMVMSEYA